MNSTANAGSRRNHRSTNPAPSKGSRQIPRGPAVVSSGRQRLLVALSWIVGVGVAVSAIVFALLAARPEVSDDARVAPDFTLVNTDGVAVSLHDYVGSPVVLYFSEGAGCDSCIYQMAAIEADSRFTERGIVVLPIVMNTAEQTRYAMARMGVTTPFLLDDGTVSQAYGTLGAGMHAGLPGHGFVIVNTDGEQVWYGNYPSMWLDPEDLLAEVEKRV